MARPRGTGLCTAFGADALRDDLRQRIAPRGAAKRIAHETGVTVSQLHRVAHGKLPASERVAKALGWRRIVRFERQEVDS